MLGHKRKSKNSGAGPFARFIRSVLSVVILTALVLGVTLGAKELYAIDSARFGRMFSGLLAKVHINVDEEQVGQVAGKFAERISQTNLGSGVSSSRSEGENDKNVYASKELLTEVAVLSDIHDDIAGLQTALQKIKSRDISSLLVLGDVTGYGDVASLEKVKNILDGSSINYYILPGDHDLAQTSSFENFSSVFGKGYGSFVLSGVKFVYFQNAANYTLIPDDNISWLEKEINDTDFLFISQPLYTEELAPPFNRIFMGGTNSEVTDASLAEKQENVRDQGKLILDLVRKTPRVKAVIAGDHHKSSSEKDSVRADLMHYVVGAVTSSLNDYPQKALQSSRFGVLSIFQDGTYELNDVVLD